jgi:hypothetical protein
VLWCSAFVVALAPMPIHGERKAEDIERPPVSKATGALRIRLVEEFEAWLTPRPLRLMLETMDMAPIPQRAGELASYGKHLYVSRRTLRDFADIINGVQTRYHWTRGSLSGAWRVQKTWLALHPSANNKPFLVPVLYAFVVTALPWGWWKLATLLLVGVYALLRAAELYSLCAALCSMEEDHGIPGVVVVGSQYPKTTKRGLWRQYLRLDEAMFGFSQGGTCLAGSVRAHLAFLADGAEGEATYDPANLKRLPGRAASQQPSSQRRKVVVPPHERKCSSIGFERVVGQLEDAGTSYSTGLKRSNCPCRHESWLRQLPPLLAELVNEYSKPSPPPA